MFAAALVPHVAPTVKALPEAVVSMVTVASAVAGIGTCDTAVNDVAISTKPCVMMVPEEPIDRTVAVASIRHGQFTVAVLVVVIAVLAASAIPATPP